MGINRHTFNLFLTLVSMVLVATACATTGSSTSKEASKKAGTEKKLASTLRFHLETESDPGMTRTSKIKVLRSSPVELTVSREAFLDEGEITLARVMEGRDGGFQIAVQLTTHGQLVLHMETTGNRNRRIAIWSRWSEGRWLAAPQITKSIDAGVYTFTPDCTLEEARRIVQGLNSVAIELKNQAKKGKQKSDNWDEGFDRFMK